MNLCIGINNYGMIAFMVSSMKEPELFYAY